MYKKCSGRRTSRVRFLMFGFSVPSISGFYEDSSAAVLAKSGSAGGQRDSHFVEISAMWGSFFEFTSQHVWATNEK